MSINNLDYTSYNYLTNLASVNANEVNTDVLTKSDPDISDLQFDMLEGINTNETIQEQIDNVTVDVSTLQGQMNTANTNISALQVNMGIAQSDINTLQSEMNTAQDDINDLQTDVGVLYGFSATNTAAIAGLSVSQAAQDVTLAAHTASIASLNSDVNDLQSDVSALQVKTADQSWGSLTGTTFSSKVNVGGVTLNISSASTFDNGISASAPITTTSTMSSTSGTSSFNALNVNTTIEVIGDAIIGNTLYVGRTVNAEKKVVLYDGGTDNDYDYTGMWTSQTIGKNYFNYEIDGTGGAFRWHYGNGLGNARKKILDINDAEFYSYNATFSFLNSQIGGQTQNVTFTDNAFGTLYMNWKTDPDNTASQNRDAAIVVDAGADGEEDDGTMTFVAGAHDMTATTRGISITGNTLVQINAGASGFDVNSTGAVTVDSIGGMTFTETSGTMFFNKTGASGGINFQSANFVSIDAADEFFLTGGGVAEMTSTGSSVTLTANQKIELNATNGNVDIRAFATDVTIRGDELIITTDSLTSGIVHNSAASSNWDMDLKNALNSYGIRLSETGTGGLTILGVDDGINQISSNGVNSSLNIISGGDIGMSATDIVIEATGTSSGSIDIIANEALDLFSTLDAINLTSGLNTNINASTIKLDATTQILHHIAGVEVQEIGASGIINNPTGTITNQINGTTKQTISSTLITNTNPTVNSGLTYPISTNTALGYFLSTTTTTKGTLANINLASLSIPGAGCWLVEACFMWSGTGTPQNYTAIGLSTTSATFDNKRQQVFYQGGVAGGYGNNIQSIFNTTGASTVYFVMQVPTAVGGATVQNNYLAITKIA